MGKPTDEIVSEVNEKTRNYLVNSPEPFYLKAILETLLNINEILIEIQRSLMINTEQEDPKGKRPRLKHP